MLRVYYLDLAELVGGFLFLVVFKVVLLVGMRKMSVLLTDDPDRSIPKPALRLPQSATRVRWLVSVLLVVSAIWQVRPAMLMTTPVRLTGSGSLPAVTAWWVHHALWLNIWSILFELILAGLLVSFPDPRAVRITAALIGSYGLMAWIVLQGIGGVLAKPITFLGNSPGTGLAFACLSIPLLVSNRSFERQLRMTLAVYWGLFTVVQWWPGDGMWTGSGYSEIPHHFPAPLPGLVHMWVDGSLRVLASSAPWSTLALGLGGFVLAGGLVASTRRWPGIGSMVGLLGIWGFGQGAGLGGGYTLACGSALVFAGIGWLVMLENSKQVARRGLCTDLPITGAT